MQEINFRGDNYNKFGQKFKYATKVFFLVKVEIPKLGSVKERVKTDVIRKTIEIIRTFFSKGKFN